MAITAVLNSPDFGYVLLAGSAMAAQCVLTGMGVMESRKRVFGKEFQERKEVKDLVESDEFKKATGDNKFPKLGYPDMGNGRYSQLLPIGDWIDINNAQRAHYNYVEGIASVLALLFAAGIFFPKFAAGAGATYIVGRALYTSGYKSSGAKGRGPGAIVLDLALVALFGAALFGAVKHTGLLDRFLA